MKRKNVSKLVASVLIGSSLMMAGSTTSALADTNNAPAPNSAIMMLMRSDVPSGFEWIRDLGYDWDITVGWSEAERSVKFKDCNGKEAFVKLSDMSKYKAINIDGKLYMRTKDFVKLLQKLELEF